MFRLALTGYKRMILGNPGGSLSGAIPAAIDTLNSKPFKMALGVISPALWKSEWSPISHYVGFAFGRPN